MSNTGTINVQFTQISLPTVNGQGQAPVYHFVFNPTTLTLDPAATTGATEYVVNFTFTSNVPGAALDGETFSGDDMPSGVSLTRSGSTGLALRFTASPGAHTYHYEVSVQIPDNPKFTSSDPEIEIPPG